MSSILLSSCIYCSSNNIWKYGFYNNFQVWKCNAVIDDKSNAIALHVSEKRDMQSAILCLRKAKYIAGKPEIIVTDGWRAYPNIIRKVFGWSRKNKVKHVVAHFRKELVLHKGK